MGKRRRLVEDKALRIGSQHGGDGHQTALPPRQGQRVAEEEIVVQPHIGDGRTDRLLQTLVLEAGVGRGEGELLPHRRTEELILGGLEDEPHPHYEIGRASCRERV